MFEGMSKELLEAWDYHSRLRGLVAAMDKPGRERSIMVLHFLGKDGGVEMVFQEGEDGPVRSITMPQRLLYALANSTNLRLLIEDEIIKCEEIGEKEGFDLHVPKGEVA